jgi:hypothetical protein
VPFHSFEFLYLKDLAHFEFLLVVFAEKLLDFFHFGEAGVEGVDVVGELVGLVSKAVDADHGIVGDAALLVVGVSAAEMNIFVTAGEGVGAGGAVGRGVEAVEFFHVIAGEDALKADVNEICRDVEDVDGVRQIAQDVYESLGHLAPHVQVRVLALQQLNRVLDRTVRGQVLDNLPVYVEEDLHLVLRQVRIPVFMVQLDRRVKQRLPDVLRVVLLAHFDCVVQNFLDFDIGSEVFLVEIVSGLEDAVDS